MKNIKSLWIWAPEIYYFLFAIGWAFPGQSNIIHYPAIALACLMLLQFFLKSRIIGIMVSCVIGLFSMYLILALLSDFAKHPVFDANGIRFLGGGALLIATNITMSVFMFRKYISEPENTGHVKASQ